MTCIKVRWTANTLKIQELEYFEIMKNRWVPCSREMVKFWLSEGHSIWMNPSF
jgi:hypothetical protein